MLRLTGGEWKGRSIETPNHQKTRPTQAKLRQALFNSLQTVVSESQVLDLFAGSGSLGFEALSRGAKSVIFVESSKIMAKMIEKNALILKAQALTTIVADDVMNLSSFYIKNGPFDLIFADPPYHMGLEDRLITEMPWDLILNSGGRLCIEWGYQKGSLHVLPDQISVLNKIREKNYGDSILTTYEKI